MSRLESLLTGTSTPSYIVPLFWQHAEPRETILEEIEQMHANGIGGFVVESRPHPDFLGPTWWDNMRFILTEAKKRDMKVWVFDDVIYPSGFAAGRIRDQHPEYLKIYLRERHIDAAGPLTDSSFILKAWLEQGDSLVRVVAARRTDGEDRIDAKTLTDITAHVKDGILYWDVPEGYWRIFLFIRTRNGGEDGMKDYLNPLLPEAVRAFIDTVYEAHYSHFSEEFGKTFAGFFSDEPRFGNFPSYEAALGKCQMVLPFSDRLLNQLSEAWGKDFSPMLPCLWYDAGELSHQVRFTFMDVVSRLNGENFTRQIGDWCRQHGVRLIGHIVEDNGAHTRIGYGAGHFFRALRGQDTSGLDIVYQIWPEYTSGRVTTPFGYLDADFFYWGIAKMASSEGHLDPKKNGTTVCELFGAYGWQAGLKFMKWLTDHACVRGVNILIPHAFSPKEFPDPDCPPHFYARGNNPQWRHFNIWSAYANRVCHLLSGGTHIAPVAVLYHAEAEWAGDYEPFEKVVKTLAQSQIDCDVVPVDTFLDPAAVTMEKGGMTINAETYRALIVPYSEALPKDFLTRLLKLIENGLQVIFMQDYPVRTSRTKEDSGLLIKDIKDRTGVLVSNHDQLAGDLKNLGMIDIEVSDRQENLRYYHYSRPGEDVYFFTNESTRHTLETTVRFSRPGRPIGFDALEGKTYQPEYTASRERTEVKLTLEPYQSTFIVFEDGESLNSDAMERRWLEKELVFGPALGGPWKVSSATAKEYPRFTPRPEITGLGNISIPSVLPNFSGTLRYEMTFDLQDIPAAKADVKVFLDLGKVYELADVRFNGKHVGTRICPPYRLNITDTVKPGKNELQVDVTNTLAKQLGTNGLDRAWPQEPSGLLGPVRLAWTTGKPEQDEFLMTNV